MTNPLCYHLELLILINRHHLSLQQGEKEIKSHMIHKDLFSWSRCASIWTFWQGWELVTEPLNLTARLVFVAKSERKERRSHPLTFVQKVKCTQCCFHGVKQSAFPTPVSFRVLSARGSAAVRKPLFQLHWPNFPANIIKVSSHPWYCKQMDQALPQACQPAQHSTSV